MVKFKVFGVLWLSIFGATLLSSGGYAGQMKRLMGAKSDVSQYQIFAQVIQTAQYQCSAGILKYYMGEIKNTDFWTVRCASGKEYMVSANNNTGSTKVTPCRLLATLNIKCWKHF